MSYPDLSTVNATSDLSNLLVYVNTVTNGIAIPATLGALFLIVMLGSYYGSVAFQGRGRISVSFMVAAFVTFGMTVIAASKDGLVNIATLMISLSLVIISFVFVAFSKDEV